MRRAKAVSSGVVSGVPLLITLFAVLCLTLLSVLSLLSANSQLSLATRTSKASANYYAADFRAATIIENVKSGDFSDVERDFSQSGEVYHFAESIDRNQSLQVTFSVENGDIRITNWSVAESRDWEPEDSFDLWLGE